MKADEDSQTTIVEKEFTVLRPSFSSLTSLNHLRTSLTSYSPEERQIYDYTMRRVNDCYQKSVVMKEGYEKSLIKQPEDPFLRRKVVMLEL